MDIILLEHIDKVGERHEVVTVRNGYGRNYLIPQGKAMIANKANLGRLEGIKRSTMRKQNAMLGTYTEYAEKLNGTKLTIKMKAGESGRLFGSVTSIQLADIVKNSLGIDVDRRIIQMPAEVKELGTYTAQFKFHPDVAAALEFEVVPEEVAEEA